MLELKSKEQLVADTVSIENSVVIPPCFIGDNVKLHNSVIGPFVSIGNNSKVENSVIINSILQGDSKVKDAILENSMIGNFVEYNGKKSDISIGDYSKYTV
jgi:glucose-1-phosphate thymidylyltransferase